MLGVALVGCASPRALLYQERAERALSACKDPGSTARVVFVGEDGDFRLSGAKVRNAELQRIKQCMAEAGYRWVN